MYAKIALPQVHSGSDIVVALDMIDGRVLTIRKILDEYNFSNVPIMSYLAKYASSLYGPFREAAQGTSKFGDRKSHQMDIANSKEALREFEQDIIENAGILMVKPAGFYLDIISLAKQNFNIPIVTYQVSGEFSMIKAGGQMGWLDEENVMIESLIAIIRAGANLIITCFAKDIAKAIDKEIL